MSTIILNNLMKLSFTLQHKLNLSMLISYEVIGYKMFCYERYLFQKILFME